LLQATLKVYPEFPPSDGSLEPSLVLPTYISKNVEGWVNPDSLATGIMLIVDRSGSMSKIRGVEGIKSPYHVASPYMVYRYGDDYPIVATEPEQSYFNQTRLNLFDDTELDIGLARNITDEGYVMWNDPSPDTYIRED